MIVVALMKKICNKILLISFQLQVQEGVQEVNVFSSVCRAVSRGRG